MYILLVVLFFLSDVTPENRHDYDRLPDYDHNFRMYMENGTILSLDATEELFRYKETTEFLDSFKNDVQREIISYQLRYCPYTALCTFSFNLFLAEAIDVSTCSPCSCAADCEATENCCPDIVDFSGWSDVNKTLSLRNDDCFQNYLKHNMLSRGYRMVYKCEGDTWFQQRRCDKALDSSSKVLKEIIPVTDQSSGIVYISKQCALCNNVTIESLAYWKTELQCFGQNHLYNTKTNVVDFILDTDSCNVEYTPAEKKTDTCPHMIGNCNVTGQWAVFDSFVLSACLFYDVQYTPNSFAEARYPGETYRNVFCFLCNGYHPTSVTYRRMYMDPPSRTQIKASHLELENSRTPSEPMDTRCPYGLILDPRQDKCIKVHCSERRQLIGDKCETINDADNTVYTYATRLYPEDKITADGSIIQVSQIQQNFVEWFEEKLRTLSLFKPYPTNYSVNVCGESIFHHYKENCTHYPLTCETSSILEYLAFEIQFQITGWHSFDAVNMLISDMNTQTFDLIVFMAELTYKTYSFRFEDIHFGYDFVRENMKDIKHISENNTHKYTPCDHQFESVDLSQQKSCPFVAISTDDYDWKLDRSGLYFPVLGLKVNASEFHVDQTAPTVYICANSFIRSVSRAGNPHSSIVAYMLSIMTILVT